MQKDYQKAIAYYEKALRKKPPHSHYNDDKYNKECSIRINIALSMIAQIDMENMAEEDVGQALQKISDAKEKTDQLMKNQSEGTATRNDTVDEMQRMMDDDTGDTYYDGKRW